MEYITDVFFDLDHTLWDFEKNSALAFEKVLNNLDNIIEKITDYIDIKNMVDFSNFNWDLRNKEKLYDT